MENIQKLFVKTHIRRMYSFTRCSLIFSSLAIISFIFSILLIPPSINLFVVQGMPILPLWWYFSVSFILLASFIQWISKKPSKPLLFFLFLLFVINLWIFPQLVGLVPQAGQGWQYNFWGQASFIINTGHIDSTAWVGHNWPFPAILWTTLAKIFGRNDALFFVQNATWIVRILSLFPIYLLLHRLIHDTNTKWACMYLYVVGLWSTQLGITMQALGYLYYLYFIVYIFLIDQNNKTNVGIYISFALIGVAIIFTHLLSALFSLTTILSIFILSRNRSKQLLIILLLVSFFGTWVLHIGSVFIKESLPYAISRLFTLGFLGEFTKQVYDTPSSDATKFALLLKTGLIMALILFFGVNYIIRLYSHKKLSYDFYLPGIVAAIGIVAIAVGSAYSTTAAFSWEIFHRLFLFLLPISTYYSIAFCANKLWFTSLIILLIICTPISYSSHFSPENNAYTTLSTVTSYKFVGGYVNKANVLSLANGVGGFRTTENQYRWVSNFNNIDKISNDMSSNIVTIGDQDRRLSNLNDKTNLTENLKGILSKNDDWAKIYDSGGDTIFRKVYIHD